MTETQQQLAQRGRIPPELIAPGDVAIDAGANVGEVTKQLVDLGAIVHAYEPHPAAFERLEKRFGGHDRVTLHHAALSDRSGTTQLYLHQNSAQDPVYWSTGSSLMAGKRNVNPETSVEVPAVDIAEAVRTIGAPVRLIKMDVEGAEAVLLRRLIETDLLGEIGTLLVEPHGASIEGLEGELDAVRSRIDGIAGADVRFDWV
ncbi:MAG: FkbM family methyltransferase [Planctomycetota bacterium]